MGMVRTLLALAILPFAAQAATYYVDSNSGLNDADGLTPSTAWKNLWMVNLGAFQPGDYILLKRGSFWNENFAINSAGTQDLPITVDAYGTGNLPIIDGAQFPLAPHTGLVNVRRPYFTIRHIEIRNSLGDGINADNNSGLTITDCLIHDNQYNGIYTWNISNVLIRASQIYNNAKDTTTGWSGIGIDGSGSSNSVLIDGCTVYNNVGGADINSWNAGNGINIGNTANPPAIANVTISGSEIYDNGNKSQNQMGRGITAAFTGDITITRNNIHTNASAGAYIGMPGQKIAIVFSHNEFRNNALRQFGGFTSGRGDCFANTITVDDGSITGMGVEVGGSGPWVLTGNTFLYKAATNDTYRGYITLNDSAQDAVFQSANNFFYSVPGSPERWRTSSGLTLSFAGWQAAGFDGSSINPGR